MTLCLVTMGHNDLRDERKTGEILTEPCCLETKRGTFDHNLHPGHFAEDQTCQNCLPAKGDKPIPILKLYRQISTLPVTTRISHIGSVMGRTAKEKNNRTAKHPTASVAATAIKAKNPIHAPATDHIENKSQTDLLPHHPVQKKLQNDLPVSSTIDTTTPVNNQTTERSKTHGQNTDSESAESVFSANSTQQNSPSVESIVPCSLDNRKSSVINTSSNTVPSPHHFSGGNHHFSGRNHSLPYPEKNNRTAKHPTASVAATAIKAKNPIHAPATDHIENKSQTDLLPQHPVQKKPQNDLPVSSTIDNTTPVNNQTTERSKMHGQNTNSESAESVFSANSTQQNSPSVESIVPGSLDNRKSSAINTSCESSSSFFKTVPQNLPTDPYLSPVLPPFLAANTVPSPHHFSGRNHHFSGRNHSLPYPPHYTRTRFSNIYSPLSEHFLEDDGDGEAWEHSSEGNSLDNQNDSVGYYSPEGSNQFIAMSGHPPLLSVNEALNWGNMADEGPLQTWEAGADEVFAEPLAKNNTDDKDMYCIQLIAHLF
ncbi:hypothetical protein LguiA_025504 [Lonicera macranthoides]